MEQIAKVKSYVGAGIGFVESLLEVILSPKELVTTGGAGAAKKSTIGKAVDYFKYGLTAINQIMLFTYFYDLFMESYGKGVSTAIKWIVYGLLLVLIASIVITFIVLLNDFKEQKDYLSSAYSSYVGPIFGLITGACGAIFGGYKMITADKYDAGVLGVTEFAKGVLGLWKFEPLKKALLPELGPAILAFPIARCALSGIRLFTVCKTVK
jgi:hypothetical protein